MRRLEFFRRGNAQRKIEFGRRPDPRVRHVARAVADERDRFALDGTAFFLERENVCQDLAGMLVVGQRVDGRNAGKFGEFLHVLLRKGADDRAVNHAAHDARGILDGLAASELDVHRAQKHRRAAQFANAHFERKPRARGLLGKHQGPRLARQRLLRVVAPLALENGGIAQNPVKISPRQIFEFQQMFHDCKLWETTAQRILFT